MKCPQCGYRYKGELEEILKAFYLLLAAQGEHMKPSDQAEARAKAIAVIQKLEDEYGAN